MKQFIQTIFLLTFIASFVFGGPRQIPKSEIRTDVFKRVEPDYRRGPGAGRTNCAHATPQNPQTHTTVIDSSSNGFGMVATVTRPMDVNSFGDMLTIYRQYAGTNTTHGQLGAGYGVQDAQGNIQWSAQYNVNYNGNPPWGGGGVGGTNCAQARYPSGIAAEDYPYAVWNEYTAGPPTDPTWPSGCGTSTANASDYGGRPYFSFDEFNWGGGSFIFPADLDPLWDCSKDLWSGSVGYGFDAVSGEHHISAVYDDWTRTGSYLFTSEAVEDGYIVLGTETLIINPNHLGSENYSSRSILSMNGNGQGLLGLDGIFAGNDMEADVCGPPASNLSCNKTPMFKLTDNFGQSWVGDHGAFDLYYVPDVVFDNIFETWPNEVISDPCQGLTEPVTGFWSWYEFDMRVDNAGNPHIVISLIAETASDFPTIAGKTGFYHLTIDRTRLDWTQYNHQDHPEWINTPDGWNWSYVPLPANDSFDWSRPDGYSYLYGAMCQISLSRDNPDIVYMVANIAEKGAMSSTYDANGDGIEDDPCITQDWPWELYPNWSEDIWVAKSSDNGTTWTALDNLTKTPRDPNNMLTNNCAPEEQYVHTAHWSTDDRVYFQYDQPNWEFNEIGDPLGADCMNYVWLGYSFVAEIGQGGCMDQTACNYCGPPIGNCGFDDGSCANVIGTVQCSDGTYGCDCADVCFTYIDQPLQIIDCNGDCGGGAAQACDTTSGGLGDCLASSDICTESLADSCDDSDGDGDPLGQSCTTNCNEQGLPPDGEVNSWSDCNSLFCGAIDPLFTCDGMIACDGGRCYTCEDHPDLTVQGDCTGSGYVWKPATVGDCNEQDYGCLDVYTTSDTCPTYVANADPDDGWVPFVDDYQTPEEETGGNPDECKCTPSGAASGCNVSCPAIGDLNGDAIWNVLDIVQLANCVLASNCGDLPNGCAGDFNNDGIWNVLDIVQLANCVLASNCGGRIDDASESRLIMKDNMVSIEADGFIGGVQMTLTHGDDFQINMTDRALFADYLTLDNETRLLVITPETEELFSYMGNFEIVEIIVANSHAEVSIDLPVAASFSLSDAYPNPFNPTTTMELTMPVAGDVRVEVYNLLGQSVAILTSGYQEIGTYKLTWDANDVASGVYFVKAETVGFTKIQKLMLIK